MRTRVLPIPLLQGEVECRTPIHPTLGPDTATMTMNYTLHCRKAYTKAWEVGFRVKSLKRLKQSFCMLHAEPRAIIPDEINILPINLRHAKFYF